MNDQTPGSGGSAFGHPGLPPHWTSSSKEGVGTAYSAASRVWFTIDQGILSEVYYPALDEPQTRDMQLLITDGESFLHEEKRDLQGKVSYLEDRTLGYRIESADPEGRYRLTKEIITDPNHACVLMRVRVAAEPRWAGRLRVYVLLAPHLGTGGWGNSARGVEIAGKKVLLAWKDGLHLALGADTGFIRTSCGYVGASDGWQDLHKHRKMEWQFERAEDGNIAVMGQVDPAHAAGFTIGLAFGETAHAATSILFQSLGIEFGHHREGFIEQWRRTMRDGIRLERQAGDGGRLYWISRHLLLAHEDKTSPGARIASASIPWGQVKGDSDVGGYHLVWTRDLVQSAGGLLASGTTHSAYRGLVYMACSQHDDGGFAQCAWIDGTPYRKAMQLDEVAAPVILAWRLSKAGALEHFDPWPMVKAAAGFLVQHGPATEQERWEENSGYSPSTLAAGITALICAADFARHRGERDTALFLEEYADFLESHVERWTVTTQGTLVPGISRYYIRINPVDVGDPVPNENPNDGTVRIGNQPPGQAGEFPARDIVDPGFLQLVRYGIRAPGGSLIEDSLRVVDAVLKVDTPFGPGWHRYNHDGYGPRPDGGPFEGWGKGQLWPLLTGERGHYELAAGRSVKSYIRAMERFASDAGMLPEQVWDERDRPEHGMYVGRSAGSAMPLMWAHAEYLKLLRSAADGQVFDRIVPVADRYLGGRRRRSIEVWKPLRQVQEVAGGDLLRIQAPEPFHLVWTLNEWQTVQQKDAHATGIGIHYFDIPVGAGQHAPVRFTFYWPEMQRWEGRDYEVKVRAGAAERLSDAA